jgi:hypothetical protein
MARLREAFDYAHDLGLTLWDFAVEIQSLLADGLSQNDLRWLVCKGYVRHAGELTPRGREHRAFRSIGRLNFCKRTCFALTEEGAGFALQIIGRAPCQRGPCAALNGHDRPARPTPRRTTTPHHRRLDPWQTAVSSQQ